MCVVRVVYGLAFGATQPACKPRGQAAKRATARCFLCPLLGGESGLEVEEKGFSAIIGTILTRQACLRRSFTFEPCTTLSGLQALGTTVCVGIQGCPPPPPSRPPLHPKPTLSHLCARLGRRRGAGLGCRVQSLLAVFPARAPPNSLKLFTVKLRARTPSARPKSRPIGLVGTAGGGLGL